MESEYCGILINAQATENAFDNQVRSFAEGHGIPYSIAREYMGWHDQMLYSGSKEEDLISPQEFARTACKDSGGKITFKEPPAPLPKNSPLSAVPKSTDTGSKYLRTIKDKEDPAKTVTTDLYGILDGVGLPYLGSDGADAALTHALKKCLFAGERGSKDTMTDLNEALVSLKRAIELAQPERKCSM